jgi:hypothetical protein
MSLVVGTVVFVCSITALVAIIGYVLDRGTAGAERQTTERSK